MAAPRRHCRPRFQIPIRGLSPAGVGLVELLVACTIGSMVILVSSVLLGPQLRMHQRMEGRTRLQERWARINFLLNTEIQEAHSAQTIANGLRLTTCEPLANIYVANPSRCNDGQTAGTGTPGTDVTIDYVLNPTTEQLSRTGPGIDCFGQLVANSTNAGFNCERILSTISPSTSMLISGVLQFNPTITNQADQTVNYTLSFRDPLHPQGSIYTNKSSAARARIKKL